MDNDLIAYITTYYTKLCTDDEKAAMKYHYALTVESAAAMKAWGNADPRAIALLDKGHDQFVKTVAERILLEHKEHVLINNCPTCGKLARTPNARQCRHCGHDWH